MRIISIKTKYDQKIDLGQLTVLVGPNNSGKTTTISEINTIFEAGYRPERVLIDRLAFRNIELSEFEKGLQITASTSDTRLHVARGLVATLTGEQTHQFNLKELTDNLEVINNNGWQNVVNMGLGRLKVTLLDSTRRLQIANQVQEGRTDPNPLSELYGKKNIEPNLQDAFTKAFGLEIKLDISSRQFLRFRISKKFESLPPDPREQQPIMEKYPILDKQGEGFRSFVGIILGIILSEGRVVLIDEPEAFLHPTQARVLAEWIANYSEKSDTQIIICTHSSDILEGLLQKHSDAVILRVDRKDDVTKYHRISSELTKKLTQMPLVSSQPILESIFYRGVIITEGDTDRVIYKSVYVQQFDKREHLFVTSIGKHSIKKIVQSLKEANVPVSAIVDIDILNDETTFKNLLESFLGESDLSQYISQQNSIFEHVEGMEQTEIFSLLKEGINKLAQNLAQDYSLDKARHDLNQIHAKSGKWHTIKKNGIDAMPDKIQDMARTLLDDLKKIGLFVVPVGELESWTRIEEQDWLKATYDVIASGGTPEQLTCFVAEIVNYLDKN